MEEFVNQKLINGPDSETPSSDGMEEKTVHPEKPQKRSTGIDPFRQTDNRLETLLQRVERTLRDAEKKPRGLSFSDWDKPRIVNVSWFSFRERMRRRFFIVLPVVGLVAFGVWFGLLKNRVATVTDLPYPHPSCLDITNGKVYIVDWFRKALFVHEFKAGLPLLSVENLPNNFVTGLAFNNKSFWTLDGFSQKIIEHAFSNEHRVMGSVPSPGKKSVGLLWDGTDLWTADLEGKKLYRLYGNDISTIRNQYTLPAGSATAFYLKNNRLWLLDGLSREIVIYRLQEPLRQLTVYDLDPFLRGGSPTGIYVEEKKIWVLTDGPSRLIQIPIRTLEKMRLKNN
jgi:hypothetical protein